MDKNAAEERIQDIKKSMKKLADRGEKRVDELRSRAVEVKDQAMHRGSAMLDQSTDFIRSNPLKAVGIAFGVGYIGMRLFRR